MFSSFTLEMIKICYSLINFDLFDMNSSKKEHIFDKNSTKKENNTPEIVELISYLVQFLEYDEVYHHILIDTRKKSNNTSILI